jgi:hypothetical protein
VISIKDYLLSKNNNILLKNIALFFFYFVSLISCSKEDVLFIPTNEKPTATSIKNIGGSNNESLYSVIKTADGGFITAGHTQSSDGDISTKNNTSYDYWVVKFDKDSNQIWNKTFGGTDDDRARDIIQLNDGSFIVSGFSRSTNVDVSENAGNYDFWIIKLDNSGNLVWEKSFGFSGADQAYTLFKTKDNHILVGGTLDVTASGGQGNSKSAKKHAGGDYWLLKLDTNGNKIWSRYFGGLFTDTLYDIEETAEGNFILVGSSDSNDNDISNNIGTYDFWIVIIDAEGNLRKERNFGGSEIDESFSITKTNDNHFLIAGNTRSSDNNIAINNGSSDIWIIKINSEAELIWEKNFGGSSFEEAKKIIPNANGGYLIAGSSRSADIDLSYNYGNKDAWIISIDNNGKLIWQENFGGSNLEELNAIVTLNNGTLIAVGETWSSDFNLSQNKGFSDALTLTLQ